MRIDIDDIREMINQRLQFATEDYQEDRKRNWNYAHMWDTMRRALEESAREGLEVTPMDVLNGMFTLEELEERHRQEREEHDRRRIRQMQTMWDGKIELLREVEKNG